MKKLIIIALVILAGASSSPAMAGKKDKKTNDKEGMLKSERDSVSYAAGMQFNNGLIPFLQQQFKVDTTETEMSNFKVGFNEARERENDKKFNAYVAGTQIAALLEQKLLPPVMKQFEGTADSIDKEMFYKGFLDGLNNNFSNMDVESSEQYIKKKSDDIKMAQLEAKYGDNRRAGEAFLKKNAKEKGVVTLPSGLQYKVITEGSGAKPQKTDKVKVKYEGTLVDGTVFDSSLKRGDGTSTFGVGQVIKGWTEALQMMPAGSKWKLFIPYDLAYGTQNKGKIKPFSALIFDVELLEINPKNTKK